MTSISDVQHYLKRINFSGSTEVSKSVLFALQEHHLLNVPFENLDIHYDQEITMNINTIFKKIVLNNRGGFCYELNGLFYHLLKTLGFEVKMISGRVYTKDGHYGKEYDHLAMIASVDHCQYLVDAGFGKFSLRPLEIRFDTVLNDSFGQFQFDHYNDSFFRINAVRDEELTPLYIFETKERALPEFQDMCKYHQTSKESHFTQKKVISMVTNDGRITLNETQVKITKGEVEEIMNFSSEDFNSNLDRYFNIKL